MAIVKVKCEEVEGTLTIKSVELPNGKVLTYDESIGAVDLLPCREFIGTDLETETITDNGIVSGKDMVLTEVVKDEEQSKFKGIPIYILRFDGKERLIETGKIYMMVNPKTNTIVMYARVEFIELSKHIGHREIGLFLLVKPSPLIQTMILPLQVLDLSKPTSFCVPENPKVTVVFKELPPEITREELSKQKFRQSMQLAGQQASINNIKNKLQN